MQDLVCIRELQRMKQVILASARNLYKYTSRNMLCVVEHLHVGLYHHLMNSLLLRTPCNLRHSA